MKLKKIEPRNYWMSDLFPSNFNNLVNTFFDNDVSEVSPSTAFFRPSTEIKETDHSFDVLLSIPGIKKDEVSIELHNGVLEVSGERKNEKEEKNEKYHLSEITYGKFTRRFQLPDNVDPDKIDASVEDGILKLSIPKSEDKKPKQISVK
ncbi:MAG: Hsp20/alpha crystallin family protein [Bacteroidia bacterium]